jgi:hypothetical protein
MMSCDTEWLLLNKFCDRSTARYLTTSSCTATVEHTIWSGPAQGRVLHVWRRLNVAQFSCILHASSTGQVGLLCT